MSVYVKSARHWTVVRQDSEKSEVTGGRAIRNRRSAFDRAVRDTIVISSAAHPINVSVAAAHGLEKRRQSHSLDATKLKRYTGWRG